MQYSSTISTLHYVSHWTVFEFCCYFRKYNKKCMWLWHNKYVCIAHGNHIWVSPCWFTYLLYLHKLYMLKILMWYRQIYWGQIFAPTLKPDFHFVGLITCTQLVEGTSSLQKTCGICRRYCNLQKALSKWHERYVKKGCHGKRRLVKNFV